MTRTVLRVVRFAGGVLLLPMMTWIGTRSGTYWTSALWDDRRITAVRAALIHTQRNTPTVVLAAVLATIFLQITAHPTGRSPAVALSRAIDLTHVLADLSRDGRQRLAG